MRGVHRDKRFKAIILAAGYATRLYPLTRNIPKPLLMVTRSRAVIDFIVEPLEASLRCDEVIIVTNQKFYTSFSAWAGKRKHKVKITVLNDRTLTNEDRLGAIGDIYFAKKRRKIASDFLVIGGDNLFDRGFSKFLDFALKRRNHFSLGLYDIGSRLEARRFGVVAKDEDSRITSFLEKPSKPASSLIATCLYFFPAQKADLLKIYVLNGRLSNDATGHFISWLLKRECVYGYCLKKGQWFDIGHLNFYKEVINKFKRRKK